MVPHYSSHSVTASTRSLSNKQAARAKDLGEVGRYGERAELRMRPSARGPEWPWSGPEGDGSFSSFALLLCIDNKEWQWKWSGESKRNEKTGAHFVTAAWTRPHQTFSTRSAVDINSLHARLTASRVNKEQVSSRKRIKVFHEKWIKWQQGCLPWIYLDLCLSWKVNEIWEAGVRNLLSKQCEITGNKV